MIKPKTIYAIRHNVTKRIYVGCSTNPSRRVREHRFSNCYDKERMWMCVLKSNEPETGYNLSKWERPISIEDFQNMGGAI